MFVVVSLDKYTNRLCEISKRMIFVLANLIEDFVKRRNGTAVLFLRANYADRKLRLECFVSRYCLCNFGHWGQVFTLYRPK